VDRLVGRLLYGTTEIVVDMGYSLSWWVGVWVVPLPQLGTPKRGSTVAAMLPPRELADSGFGQPSRETRVTFSLAVAPLGASGAAAIHRGERHLGRTAVLRLDLGHSAHAGDELALPLLSRDAVEPGWPSAFVSGPRSTVSRGSSSTLPGPMTEQSRETAAT
jgi:hypothetical protein